MAAAVLAHITLETGARNHRARTFMERAGYQEEDIRLTKPVDSLRLRSRSTT